MSTLLDTNAAAELLDVHPQTIRDLVRRGILKPVRLTRKLQFTKESIQAAIAERSQPACGCTDPQPAGA